ncbi:acyl-CoA dehydrogenase [Actinomadura sp. KC216]|uniref:acyl-CoA dehydrogenase family protein n=1 Tax=Actinomadura sp. KC216 TaxID=2530370 RepID=UPI0010526FD9|nr:acyl-CoA dehydrogenase family protein [Actinomadura sp. KC216]TDB87464.1 acyl-CoA dehydrogenase [Actinomadura sp. KC216]
MDFRDTPEEAGFRARLREWLAGNAPADYDTAADHDTKAAIRRRWHRSLYDAGYMGMAWPREYGGQDLSPVYDAILNEEVGASDSPPVPGQVNYLGRAIYTYGSEEQKRRFLPTLLSGEIQWCQGFSEPGAGSDLAALQTRAELKGSPESGVYVVNGQKMWTSGGQYSDWCLLLARTDPDAPKHKGISAFLVDMKTPGITTRPIVLADGEPETSEVFWDDVEIPAGQMLGAPGQGWHIAMTTVTYERGPADVGMISNYRKTLRAIEETAAAKGLTARPEVRRELARAYVLGEALRLNVAQQLSLRVSGREPGPEGSVGKLLWSQAEQSLYHLALDLAGADAVTGAAPEVLAGYFRSRPISVYGGSSQIQRNLLAWHILSMPRKPTR